MTSTNIGGMSHVAMEGEPSLYDEMMWEKGGYERVTHGGIDFSLFVIVPTANSPFD